MDDLETAGREWRLERELCFDQCTVANENDLEVTRQLTQRQNRTLHFRGRVAVGPHGIESDAHGRFAYSSST
jgi:hypothetical protein